MSKTVLPQLVEAESLLSAQEAALMQQLAEIQEQRQGLQTVIAMFESSADGDQSAATAVIEELVIPAESADAGEDVEDEDEDEAAEEIVVAKPGKVAKAKSSDRKAKLARTRKARAAKSTQAKKVDGRTAHWQSYVLDQYRQQRLQDVVTNVLEVKPKDSFKIADVMLAIFEDDMPKAEYLKARSRISNILSAGARDNEWYRGRGGTYSMSKKAVKA